MEKGGAIESFIRIGTGYQNPFCALFYEIILMGIKTYQARKIQPPSLKLELTFLLPTSIIKLPCTKCFLLIDADECAFDASIVHIRLHLQFTEIELFCGKVILGQYR
jgi:fucose 4-O-acetylase-like acetyltransferase